MRDAYLAVRRAAGRHRVIAWALLVLVLIAAWFLIVALLPHHVVDTLRHYEEQANGVHEASGSG